MKQSILAGLSALLLAVFLPMALLSPAEAAEPETKMVIWDTAAAAESEADLQDAEPEAETAAEPETPDDAPEAETASAASAQPAAAWDEATTVSLLTEGGVVSLSLREYLTGVVLSEMPASFSAEALKAQAVAARTFTLKKLEASKHADADLCADSACCQAWTSREALAEKLGSAFSQYWQKAAEAVTGTDGLVLTYGGQLIDAVYFSCSGGSTEDAVAVWGGDVPYLQAVESPGEEISKKFETQVTVPLAQFRQILEAADPDVWFSGSADSWFGPCSRTEGGGVATWEIGGQSFTGTQLRSLFSLNSANFIISAGDSEIVFTVSGYGHRVGMSQYGAEAMARAGSDFEEILLHYYTGVTLTQMAPDQG